MTYLELVQMCSRAVGVAEGVDDLRGCVHMLMSHQPMNRAVAAEFIARLAAEFIDGQNVLPKGARMH